MKKNNSNKNDRILNSSSTSQSRGISTSSNITIESASASEDDKNSLFPNFSQEKEWASKTTETVTDYTE